MWGGHGRLDC
jgi:hypothetical protein